MKVYINVDHSSVMKHADDKLKTACEQALTEKYGQAAADRIARNAEALIRG